jgi:amphi-Trp domain-containing protein
MPKQSLEFSGNVSAAIAADYLEALARGLRLGEVALESGTDNVALVVSGNLNLEVEARSKHGQRPFVH